MSESAKWYVVHTYSGYENKVAQTIMKVVENRKLHHLIEEVQVPTEMVMEPNEKTNKMQEVERKTYPGYVLVKMILTDDSWYVVRNVRGCTGFVGANSNKPVPLTDKEAAAMGVNSDSKPASVEINFKAGDKVKITAGPMEGIVGEVESVDTEAMQVNVKVSMFGRDTSAALDVTMVAVSDEY